MHPPKNILLCGPDRERLEAVFHAIPPSAREHEFRGIYASNLRQVISTLTKHGYGIAVLFLDLVGKGDSDHLATIMLRTQLASPRTLILLRGPAEESLRDRIEHEEVRFAADSLRSAAFNHFHPDEPLEKIGRALRCSLQFASFETDRNTQAERLLLAHYERVQALYVAESRNEPVSNHVKGTSLEDLACALFRTINGWARLAPRRQFGRSEEIDIVIQNESPERFWQQQYGTRIFVECKNSSRATGLPVLERFQHRVASHGPSVRLGFLIARRFTSEVLGALKTQKGREKIVVHLDYQFALSSLVYAPRRAERLRTLVEDVESGIPSWQFKPDEPNWGETP